MGPKLSAFCDGELQGKGARGGPRAPAGMRGVPGSRSLLPGHARCSGSAGAGDARHSLHPRARARRHRLAAFAPAGGCERFVGGAGGRGRQRTWSRNDRAGEGAVVCAGTAGGTAACIAAGVTPATLGVTPTQERPAKVERVAKGIEPAPSPVPDSEPTAHPDPAPVPDTHPANPAPPPAPKPAPSTPAATEAGPIDLRTASGPGAAPPPPEPPSEGGSAAGEFGP